MSRHPFGRHPFVFPAAWPACSRVWALICAAALSAAALSAGSAAGAAPITVDTQDGKQLSGELVGLDAQGLILQTAAGREKLAPANVLSIKPSPAGAAAPPKATCRVELVDGSLIAATTFRAAGGTAHVEPVGSAELTLPTRSIHWVRFTGDDRGDKLAKEWAQIVDGKAASDLLVVRKQGALDYLEGVLESVDDEVVRFELEKESIPVKRPKVEGLIYYHPQAEDRPEPLAVAIDRGGSRWQVKAVEPAGERWNLTTLGGLKVVLDPEKLERLDLSSVNTQYLGALEPVSFQFTPYFPPKTELPVLSESNKPRRDLGFDGLPLKLDGKAYARGVALHSRSEVGYRLPGKYRRFKALVGIDDAVRPGGDVQLEIRADGKLLWEGRVRGSEPAQTLDLDIAGVKRIDILVDFGADLDVADVVDFCEARMTK